MIEHFTEKIRLGIRSCQFHLQGIITHSMLENLSFHLFQIQPNGVFIELIILMNQAPKTIRISNILLRIASGGGQVYFIDNEHSEEDCFLLIDKRIRITLTETADDHTIDSQSQYIKNDLLFKSLVEKATPVVHQSGQPYMHFSASKEWVKVGETIELNWEVAQAQSVILQPLNIPVPLSGHIEVQIDMDCLFMLQASNEDITSEKRIFIKAVTSLGLTFSVFMTTEQLEGYIPLEARPEIPHHYAIPPDCHLRLYWDADRMGILREQQWGEIPVHGFRDFQIKEDTSFLFTWKTIFETKIIELHFYILKEKILLETRKTETKRPSLFSLFKKRP